MSNLNHSYSDKELYQLCKKYGTATLEARRKFIGLLPEVYKRKLYKNKGFQSIFEFAAKLAGVSHEQVKIALRLNERFSDKIMLKKALVSGEVSINKLVKVSLIATAENQDEILRTTKILPNRALEVFVRDFKKQNGAKSRHVPEINGITDGGVAQGLKLAEDVKNELTELQEKGIDVNEFLREALKKRELEISQEKEKLADEIEGDRKKNSWKRIKPNSYIPVKIRRIIRKEHGNKCSILGCNKPAKTIHHTQRFAMSKTHDPRYLAPLCREHHRIAHSIDVRYVKKAS